MNDFEVSPRRVLASNVAEAGRAVVRAADHIVLMPQLLSYEDRKALDAELRAIDEAQLRGLETGNDHFISRGGR